MRAVVGKSSFPKILQHFLDDFSVKEAIANPGFASFFLWLVRHAAISAYYILLYTFDQKPNIFNLSVLYTSSHFDRPLEAFWGAADLSVVYAFPLFTHETNMFAKHQKNGKAKAGRDPGDPG